MRRETPSKPALTYPTNPQLHHTGNPNKPPSSTLTPLKQPILHETIHQPALNQSTKSKPSLMIPPSHLQYPNSLLYTPSSVLISMVNNQLNLKQVPTANSYHKPKPPIPPPKPMKPQTPIHNSYPSKNVKIEPISPIKKSGLNSNPQAYTEKKWKRTTGSLRGNRRT